MSDLAQLTGTASASDDVLPGHILSPWSLLEISEAEQEFEQQHLRTVAAGAATATPAVRNEMIEKAQECIAWGYFLYDSPGFWMKMRAIHELAFLLWLSLRAKQPHITRDATKTLITLDNRSSIRDAVRKCAGWKQPPNPQGAAATTTDAQVSAPLPSPGETPTKSSPAAE